MINSSSMPRQISQTHINRFFKQNKLDGDLKVPCKDNVFYQSMLIAKSIYKSINPTRKKIINFKTDH